MLTLGEILADQARGHIDRGVGHGGLQLGNGLLLLGLDGGLGLRDHVGGLGLGLGGDVRLDGLAHRAGVGDDLRGLGLGGDDYLTKPFRVAELRARVAAHLRRQNRAPASRMVRGGIGFDLAAKTAMVGEQPLPFTRSEYAISEYLALHAGQTFSKEQIYEAVFGYDGTADDTAVTQHIKNIRAKLRTAGVAAPETVLKTIWGVGYQWKSET